MSDLFGPDVLIREERQEVNFAQSEQRKIYQNTWEHLPSSFKGPQPFCRVCQRGVDGWAWDRYDGGVWGVTARCHGQTCGTVFQHLYRTDIRVEAFCEDEPHLPGTQIWFVRVGGEEIQPSPQRIQEMMDSYPVLTGDFGHWCKRNAKYVGWAIGLGGGVGLGLGFR